MARNTRSTPLEDIFNLTAKAPWWVGVALAAVSYLVMHFLMMRAPTPVKGIQDMSGAMFDGVIRGLAIAGQYLLPMVFLGGALASAVIRHRRRELVTNIVHAPSPGFLNNITWQEFEALLAEAFKLKGFTVSERGGRGPDGGVDLALRRGNEKALVQCKQWRAVKVPVQTVRELFGVMAAERADHGYVVTSGTFTTDALEFARGRNIELMDGSAVFAMFETARQASGRKEVLDAPAAQPPCPKCAKPMVKRIAKAGTNAGKPFWGCPSFPSCRGTRPIP
jgi:restriction system protein